MTSLTNLFKLLRLSHWTKAAFVLLGVVYAGAPEFLPDALLAALSFCLIASAVYIYNDFQDREEDRLHPQKRERPLASGEVSLDFALSLLAILLIGGLVLAWAISSTLAALLGIYLLINLAYNHLLKSIPVLDVLCIASGFLLRVLAGTIGIGLPISLWLAVSATLISLFIALCKRRLEKQLHLLSTRAVLKKYSSRFLDILIAITAVASFATYLLYTIYAREESFYFLLTLPFAAIGIWRFAWLSTRGADIDDPVSLVFNDNLSRFNLLCFLVLTLIALAK
ncbi:decaprenyl-phosphate phosphoribosyltransferase [Legionella jordanis]|uniref:Phosphoribose diphosphate:decaprenyl-phosphate phosphoribosyltransferase n=1 Tax=Legionella jordanis TaxID=456 RepID=A0A0W0V888_9GAMM|nr:decaprenyl-phosphate phosphoribosyltransferase [Legionella jordanis]KTD16324.1 phosphoribose diphosphate:decaprenyl-phosphate phosphoribosyltransferase [Legionella jordanis]RMX04463.1 decaprenyl-phosphate phosphoribosyltransferase [Legionella jordanis]VEH12218.1 4-hydroxybenzoate octaprenyltransferase [Legionella jordanis]HAT8713428.1 decaprenyl-phosphate phosphoribosyltransferase [Legionella jordanis]